VKCFVEGDINGNAEMAYPFKKSRCQQEYIFWQNILYVILHFQNHFDEETKFALNL